MGMSVLYLGGTTTPEHNWQAEAVGRLLPELVVIANPRWERPTIGHNEDLVQIARQRRHLRRADLTPFWFDGDQSEPTTMIELGTVLADPGPMAVGVSPRFP